MKKKQIYKIDWKVDDNPNGWVEPTTHCQLKCEGCYRGLAEKNPLRRHEDLKEIKKEVDWFIKKRNVQTISIAGGEPLMYPQLEELVGYIYIKRLKTKIYTNGLLLSEDKLTRLKNAGVTEIIVHIDKFQRKSPSEEVMNNIREKYCTMFRKVGDVNLGFIMPLSKKNISDLKTLAPFFQKNADIVNLVVFTVYKEMLPNKTISSDLDISMDEVSAGVRESFGLQYCAYLGKKLSTNISWLFSLSAYSGGAFLGSFDGRFYKKIQERYYSKKGKYFITVRNKPTRASSLLFLFYNRSVRNILSKMLFKWESKVNTQVVLIIDAPTNKNGAWDLCDGCPDAMMYKDVLVPSCLLERIKSGEKIITY